jgi:hypothetical protein
MRWVYESPRPAHVSSPKSTTSGPGPATTASQPAGTSPVAGVDLAHRAGTTMGGMTGECECDVPMVNDGCCSQSVNVVPCGQQMSLCVVRGCCELHPLHLARSPSYLYVEGGWWSFSSSLFAASLLVARVGQKRVSGCAVVSVVFCARKVTLAQHTHTLAHTNPPGGTTPSLNVVAFSPTDTSCALARHLVRQTD